MAKVSLRAYNREIEAMIDRSQLDEAIAHCLHILKTFPKHLETYRLLGKAYLEYKRYGDAVDVFSRVLVAVPNDFVANVGLSIIRDEESKLDDAIWHMERAFEVQPSNSAIQGELQRLYARRDGVAPPRIRMTRGALAHMYVQGELYPQAISEIKNVLKEDAGRSDMQALLARAHFKNGQKNEAVEVSSALLRRYPYCLEPNRVLAEILGADKPENAKAYRQRVIELDPYAAHINGSFFQPNDAPDMAVMLDHLEWNGQPADNQADWRDSRSISLEGERARDEQPDWLRGASRDTTPTVRPAPEPASAFEASLPPAQPADEIPDFLRAAGWGESTGAFDESKPAFAEEPAAPADSSLAQGDLPDWVKAMAPKQDAQPAAEEEMPDWINKIGPASVAAASAAATSQPGEGDWMGALGQPASEQPDWLKGLGGEEPQAAPPTADQPDWLKGFDSTPAPASSEQPDWLQGISDETPAAPKADDLGWLNELGGQPAQAEAQPAASDMDFLASLTSQPPESSAPTLPPTSLTFNQVQQQAGGVDDLGKSQSEIDDSLAWLEGLAAKQGATEGLLTKPEERLEQEPDWIKQVKGEPARQPPAQPTPPASIEDLGKSQSEIDDSLAWLEGLAAKQGATEGLLTKPEERLEAEPDWVKMVKSSTGPLAEQKTPEPAQPVGLPPANVADLGKSQSEIDDSLAWLEGLAAKQGATEGLLTKPEERLEAEPDWVKQVKSSTGPLAEQKTPEPAQPVGLTPANVADLGKSQSEIDDSLAWLEGLAAKQGATEGLLTKPEERLEAEPDWVKQVKSAPPQPAAEQKPVEPEPVPAAKVEDLGKSQSEIDDSLAWLEGLAAKQGATEGLLTKPEERLEQEPDWIQRAKSIPSTPSQPVEEPVSAGDTAAWLKSLDDDESDAGFKEDETAIWLKSLDEKPAEPAQPAADELPAWMRAVEEEKPVAAEPAVPAEEAPVPAWSQPVEESKPEAESLPGWLSSLDQEEEKPAVAVPGAKDDLPAWLRDETGEVVAEPVKIEPTRATDWKPADAKREETSAPPPPPVVETRPEPKPAPKPAEPKPARKPKPAEPKPEYREPVTIRGTGMLSMPVDPILGSARTELTRSNIPGALETYGKLIKKGRFLDEVIFDLREALYRYPVEVSIWQSLGDAYMRANRLQDALDAYTKAEELLR